MITDDMVEAELDAWFTDPQWRDVFADHPVRKFMRAAIEAAAAVAGRQQDEFLRIVHEANEFACAQWPSARSDNDPLRETF